MKFLNFLNVDVEIDFLKNLAKYIQISSNPIRINS